VLTGAEERVGRFVIEICVICKLGAENVETVSDGNIAMKHVGL